MRSYPGPDKTGPGKLSQSLCFTFSLVLVLVVTGCASSRSGLSPVKTLMSIGVTPATASIAIGATEQFAATATYSDGSTADISSTATWAAASSGIATVNSSGLATGVAAGSTAVSASMNGMSGTTMLSITGGTTKTLTSIAVTPGNASIAVAATEQFTATATYSDGSTANISTTVTWATASAAIATINSTGLATGVAAGSSSVTATLSGVTGTTPLTVTAKAKTLNSIAVTPANASIAVAATEQFTATATYSDGSTANISSTVTWATASAATATINSTGLATGVAAGSTSVTASLSGVTGTTPLTVTAAKTIKSIAVTPGNVSIAVGATQQFTATATYSDNSTANISSTATWAAASTAVATINATGLATGAAMGSTSMTASLSGVTGMTTLTVTSAKTIKSIAITPSSASFAVGATQQFTATATYSDSSTANISTTATWAVANIAVATIDNSGLASAVASGTTTVSATQGGVSGSSSFTVTIASGTGVNIPMWHVDPARSGLNASELSLTPSNVSAQTFGKLFSYMVDGYVYATPLLMSNITINGAAHNVLYVATEHNSVYAFDADNYGSGAPLWQVSLLQAGETPMTDGPIQPYQGVTSTPVIDPKTKTIYVVSAQTLSGNSSFRLSALDITTGAPKFGSPITISASVPGTNSDATAAGGIDSLNTSCVQRAALLLANGSVYIGFGGCHAGWLLQYDAATLAQTGKFDMSPNNNGEGPYASAGGVWMGGGGPVADSNGNIYIVTGNGPFVPTAVPTNPAPTTAGAWADSMLRFSPTPSNGMLVLEDYFTPQDFAYMDCADSDLAAGGLLLIPGMTPPQLIAGGKMGKLYFVSSSSLGEESSGDAGAIQTLEWGAATPGGSALVNSYTSPVCPYAPGNLTATINSFEIFGTSAYFNGSIYLGITPTAAGIPSGIRQFTYSGGQWVPETDTSEYTQQNTRGTTPFVSANGTSNGILWMLDQGLPIQNGTSGTTNATLRAYPATDLSNELYNSSTNPSDVPGYGIKFSSPVVGNGKAYISTGHDLPTVTNPQGEIDVYGLN